jgi:aspartyl-tRNA synthetase
VDPGADVNGHGLTTTMRTHACGELRAHHAGEEVVLCGWVAHQRDHGGVIFLDLRDREGIVQVVVHPESAPQAHAIASELRSETVVRVRGRVQPRKEGTINAELPSGEIEVDCREIDVLAEAETPPFPIEDRVEADETLRLRYRYLDLRRPEMQRVLQLRHRVIRTIRRFLDERGFVDVETPSLTRSTPEGARDFLVPSRLQPGSFYALPQSPQLFKQILMVAGLDRYYQIVKCFRDEAFRADRQPEFTQLDLEMSFVNEEDVLELTEQLFVEVMREAIGVDVETPFPRMTYADSMDRYGTDKPDMRYQDQMVIADLSEVFRDTEFRAFSTVLAGGGVIRGIAVPWRGELSRTEADKLVEAAKGRGAAGLVWLKRQGSEVQSPVAKFFSRDEIDATIKATDAQDGDVICIVADQPSRVHVALDGLRRDMAARLGLATPGDWRFIWITEPPLFEWSDEFERWQAAHHPFTMPMTDDLEPETGKARAYDIVLNGVELGSGSIRIHHPAIQRRVFEKVGIGAEEAEEKFGFLLRAFRYGVPPHGGIAPGIDRIVMLLAGKDNIREVIAFPKQSGNDPLTGAPSEVPDEQLRDLGLQRIRKPKSTA